MQILVNVKPEWVKQKMGVIMNYDGGRAHQIFCFMWADNHGIISHSKMHLEQMMKDLLEEAEWTCNRHLQVCGGQALVLPLRSTREQGGT